MLWTIVGLLMATAVSIEGAVSSERSRGLKLLLIGLALTGAIVAGISAYDDNISKTKVQSGGERRLSVCAVKGAGVWRSSERSEDPCTGEADGSGAGFGQEGQFLKRFKNN